MSSQGRDGSAGSIPGIPAPCLPEPQSGAPALAGGGYRGAEAAQMDRGVATGPCALVPAAGLPEAESSFIALHEHGSILLFPALC
jgi:hypothetical protein